MTSNNDHCTYIIQKSDLYYIIVIPTIQYCFILLVTKKKYDWNLNIFYNLTIITLIIKIWNSLWRLLYIGPYLHKMYTINSLKCFMNSLH